MNTFFTYMLRCSDGSYYVGHTDALERRLAEHQAGATAGYTRNRRPVSLVWCSAFPCREEAFASERRIKGWSRKKKEALIREDWQAIHEHAKCRSVLRLRERKERAHSAREEQRSGVRTLRLRSADVVVGEPRRTDGLTPLRVSGDVTSAFPTQERR